MEVNIFKLRQNDLIDFTLYDSNKFEDIKIYNYVYITTNLITGMQYIGDHSTNNLNDKYLGSGKIIIDAIRKYKKKNFSKSIIEYFKTRQEAFDAQENYIKMYNTLYPNGYNLSPTGGHGINGGKLSQSTKDKISLIHKGRKTSPETKQKLKNLNSGENNAMFGISFYDVWLNKYGKDIADKKLKDHSNNFVHDKDRRSKWLTEVIKKTPLITCEFCNKTFNSGNYAQHNKEKCKLKYDKQLV